MKREKEGRAHAKGEISNGNKERKNTKIGKGGQEVRRTEESKVKDN